MPRKSHRHVLAVVFLGLALSSLFASSAGAFSLHRNQRREIARSYRFLGARGVVFYLLGSLFGKSRGAMDPNGTGGDPPGGPGGDE